MQARFGDDVHTAAQQILRIQQQAAQGKSAGPWGQGHQQINVTVVAAVSTAHRTKNPNIRDAAPACQSQQFGAVDFDQRMHGPQCSHAEMAAALAAALGVSLRWNTRAEALQVDGSGITGANWPATASTCATRAAARWSMW